MPSRKQRIKRKLLADGISPQDIPIIMKVLREEDPERKFWVYLKKTDTFTTILLVIGVLALILNLIAKVLM